MFDTYIKVYGRRIHRLARRLSCDDPDLADDLEQEARIAIWRFDPKRVRTNEAAIIMRVARDAMLKWRRREYSARSPLVMRQRHAARSVIPVVTEQKIIPIRRFAPRHHNATPVMQQRAA